MVTIMNKTGTIPITIANKTPSFQTSGKHQFLKKTTYAEYLLYISGVKNSKRGQFTFF